MMAPIDPNQLLKAFEPWLNDEGGIKNKEEVPRLSSLMTKYSKKLVSRCVYINVLQNTSPEVLETFLVGDGWKTLNEWLKTAKEAGNYEFMKELLSLLQKCPVNLDRLKENDTPKVIKGLSRTSQDEEVVKIAVDVVNSWTAVIGAAAAPDSSKVKVSKKRSKHDSGDKDGNGGKDGGGEENKKVKRVSLSDEQSTASNGTTSNANEDGKDDNSISFIDNLRPAPSTVVMKQGKSNLDGLINSSETKKSSTKQQLTLATTNSKESAGGGGESSNKSSINNNKVTETTTKDDSKSDSINGSTLKRQNSNNSNSTSSTSLSTSSNSPSIAKTKIVESDLFANVLAVNESLTKPIKRKIVRQKNVDGGDGEDSNSMSRRTSVNVDENTSSRSPQEQDFMTPPPNKIIRSNSNPFQTPQSCPTPQGPAKSFPRGCLSMRSSSEKKKVRFLPDPWIKEVKHFEVEADERVNMYRINSLAAMNERKGEAAALKNHDFEKEEEPPANLAPWILIEVDVPQTLTIRGKNSVEKDVQALRHRTVMSSIFMNKNQLPDTPSEPDRCEILAMNASGNSQPPVEIPTTDTGTVSDYSTVIQPEPKSNAMYGQTGFMPTNTNYALDPLIAVAQSFQQQQQPPIVQSSYSSFSSTYNNPSVSTYNPRVVDFGNNSQPQQHSGPMVNGHMNRGHNNRGAGRGAGARGHIICKDFLAGRCKYANCRYSHDLSSQTQRARSTNMNRPQASDSTELDWGS